MSEASVLMKRTASRTGCTRRVALEMAFFTSLMVVSISWLMVNSFLDADKESVQGHWQRELPDGVGLLQEGADPLGVHRGPRKVTVGQAKVHFSKFTVR